MIQIKSAPHFEKAYRKFIRRYPFLQRKIDETILNMEENINNPLLHTHKLSGNLQKLSACTCGYDCRIVFSIEKEYDTGKEFIILRSCFKNIRGQKILGFCQIPKPDFAVFKRAVSLLPDGFLPGKIRAGYF